MFLKIYLCSVLIMLIMVHAHSKSVFDIYVLIFQSCQDIRVTLWKGNAILNYLPKANVIINNL